MSLQTPKSVSARSYPEGFNQDNPAFGSPVFRSVTRAEGVHVDRQISSLATSYGQRIIFDTICVSQSRVDVQFSTFETDKAILLYDDMND